MSARSSVMATRVPVCASPGKSETLIVTPWPSLTAEGPICPSPQPSSTTSAAAASADLARKSRRLTQFSHDIVEDAEKESADPSPVARDDNQKVAHTVTNAVFHAAS